MMINLDAVAISKFLNKIQIQPNGCHNWIGSVQPNGYGGVYVSGAGTKLAHRVAWIIHHKQQIPEGLCVLHRCDNTCCVNPEHLFLGTQQDNMKDKIQKERGYPKGLTREQIIDIYESFISGETIRSLSDRYNKTESCIGLVVSGKTHKLLYQQFIKGNLYKENNT